MTTLIGKFVHWTNVSRGRGSISMTRKEGLVESIDGDTATVKMMSGRKVTIAVDRLREAGQPSQITEFVEAVRLGVKP